MSAAAAAATLLVLATGCGQQVSPGAVAGPTATPPATITAKPSTQPSKAPPGWPDCQKLWHAGHHIPANYRGCSLNGVAVHAQLWGCSFGRPMTTYQNRYYGVVGAIVIDAHGPLEKSKRYRHNYALCTA